ncbi:MAG: hypothetical protein QOJ63_693 [Solirubrobacteraceae bacterium]|nr:hypothetical protein [Solirubrobacteraceae bacterium]
MLGGGSQALAATCASPSSLPAPAAQRVASATTSRGIETTDVLAPGTYRVSRCDADGRFLDGMTVGSIEDRTGRVILVPLTVSAPGRTTSTLYADASDPRWVVRVARRRDPDPVVLAPTNGIDVGLASRNAPAAEASTPATRTQPAIGSLDTRSSQLATAAAAGDSCTNGQFNRFPGGWTQRSYAYRLNYASFGNNESTALALIAGHRVWDQTYNDCGIGDQNNISSVYAGVTSVRASPTADGVSVADKGEVFDLGCGRFPDDPVVLACTVVFFAGGGYVETDQRYDDDSAFTNAGVSGAYDYWAVATHESGHSIGMDHAASSPYLTMYPEMSPGDVHQRTLARGDVIGLRTIYPPV